MHTRSLSDAMRRAIRQAQRDLLDAAPIVTGHGMTMRALRRRGLVEGAMPFARLTSDGQTVASELAETAK